MKTLLSILLIFLLLLAGCSGETVEDAPDSFRDVGMQPDVSISTDGDNADVPPKDNTVPTVVEFQPGKDSENVDLDAKISARFSEFMNVGTLTPTNIKVADKNGELPSETVYDDITSEVTILTSLALLNSYKVSLAPTITDLAGNPLDGTEWSFRTRDGKWSGKTSVVTSGTRTSFRPSLAVNADEKNIALSWVSQTRDNAPDYQIHVNLYNQDSKSWGQGAFFKTENEPVTLKTILDKDGNVTIVWREQVRQPDYTVTLHARFYDAKNKTWGETKDFGEVGDDLVVTYLDQPTMFWRLRSGSLFVKKSIFDNEMRTWSSVNIGQGYNFGFAKNENGKAYLTYRLRETGIYTVAYDSEKGWGLPEKRAGNESAAYYYQTTMCAAASGRFMAVWTEERGEDQYYLLYNEYDPATEKWTTPRTLEGLQFNYVETLNCYLEGDDHIMWVAKENSPDDRELSGMRFDKISNSWISSNLSGEAYNAKFNFDESNNGMLIWKLQDAIWMQRFDNLQKAWTTPESIVTADIYNWANIQLQNGRNMIVWSGEDDNGNYNLQTKTFE